MKKIQYQARSGKTQWKPVYNEAFEARVQEANNEGFCLACGATAQGVEPDARRYRCESCNEEKVYGLEELLLMGLVRA